MCPWTLTGDVVVTVANQSSVVTVSAHYNFAELIQPPGLALVTPLFGPAAGGTLVTVVGSGFSLDAVVNFVERYSNQSLSGSSAVCDWQDSTQPGLGCNDTVVVYVESPLN